MTFIREHGLVHNPGDADRFVRLVKWEGRWSATDADGFESYSVRPVVWEWARLDVSNPRAYDYGGPVWKMVPVAITEQPNWRAGSRWPNEAPSETETMRRLRIRELRRSCHVDEVKGDEEPAWIASRDERPKIQNQWTAPAEYVAA